MVSEPHPDVQELLDAMDAMDFPELDQLSVEDARTIAPEAFTGGDDVEPVGDVMNRTIPGPDGELPIRIYLPKGDGPFPIIVYFHGGGFVLGGLDGNDSPCCRRLTNAAEAAVISVDYRLAPEHPFPAAVEDADAAIRWTAKNAEEFDREWASYEENGEGYFLTLADMAWSYGHYMKSDVHKRNPYAAPFYACDLSDFPPTTVVTAGFDPLRDEGRAYADRLAEDGTPVTHRHYERMIHGFFSMLNEPFAVEQAEEAIENVVNDFHDAV